MLKLWDERVKYLSDGITKPKYCKRINDKGLWMRAQYTTIFVWQSEVAIFARKFGCMHLACILSSFPHRNKITSPRACVLLFRRRKSFIFISCSSDWLYANEFVLGVRNCGGKNNFASGPVAGYFLDGGGGFAGRVSAVVFVILFCFCFEARMRQARTCPF